jgi:hypothetical protein
MTSGLFSKVNFYIRKMKNNILRALFWSRFLNFQFLLNFILFFVSFWFQSLKPFYIFRAFLITRVFNSFLETTLFLSTMKNIDKIWNSKNRKGLIFVVLNNLQFQLGVYLSSSYKFSFLPFFGFFCWAFNHFSMDWGKKEFLTKKFYFKEILVEK